MPETRNRRLLSGREYIGVDKIDGPLIFVEAVRDIDAYGPLGPSA